MHIQGVSTRKVTKILEAMCSLQVSSTQVSWVTAEIIYPTVDATYYKIRIDGVVRDCANLISYRNEA